MHITFIHRKSRVASHQSCKPPELRLWRAQTRMPVAYVDSNSRRKILEFCGTGERNRPRVAALESATTYGKRAIRH
ncbi:MAG: hypothetical protein IBX39_09835 [Candidatus Methanoperedenaceae archaeon]|nr:hypothetical protein [Candidatus Methanoperedenaceae archaeon]